MHLDLEKIFWVNALNSKNKSFTKDTAYFSNSGIGAFYYPAPRTNEAAHALYQSEQQLILSFSRGELQ